MGVGILGCRDYGCRDFGLSGFWLSGLWVAPSKKTTQDKEREAFKEFAGKLNYKSNPAHF